MEEKKIDRAGREEHQKNNESRKKSEYSCANASFEAEVDEVAVVAVVPRSSIELNSSALLEGTSRDAHPGVHRHLLCI